MPQAIHSGVDVRIPCRCCGGAFIPFVIQEGSHRLRCPECKGETWVRVDVDSGQWQVRTSTAPFAVAGSLARKS